MDVLSLIGEGEEQPPQARTPHGRPRARGRGISERPTLNAMDVLSLIGERDEQPPQAINARGRPRANGRGRGNRGRPVASAMDVLALIGEEDEQPPFKAKRPKAGRPKGKAKGSHGQRRRQSVENKRKALRFQMQRFNTSGRAVNVDGLMLDAAPRLGRWAPWVACRRSS